MAMPITHKSLMLFLVGGLSLSASTYYISSTGNDSNNGTTQLTAWATIAHLSKMSLKSGDQILFNRGGVWREELNVPVSGLNFGAYGTGARPIVTGANLITTGWTSAGTNIWSVSVTTQPLQVWFKGGLGTKVISKAAVLGLDEWYYASGKLYVYSLAAPGSTAQIEASQRQCAVTMNNVSNETFQSIEFSKGNANTIYIGPNTAGTQSFEDVVWEESPAEGLIAWGGAVDITSSIGQNNACGLGIYGGAGFTLTGSVLSGNFNTALIVSATTGPSKIESSTITGNAALNDWNYVIANQSTQTLTASNSIILPNPYLPLTWNYLGLTDDGTNAYQSPQFTARAAPLIVVPYVDDYANLSVAEAVASAAASHGFHITYALNTALVQTTDWPAIAALAASGNEIAAHTRTHSDLNYLSVFTIRYTGTAKTATMTINVPSKTIQTFLNGSSTPDIKYTIPAFYPAAWLCNDIATTWKGYTCSQPNQSWWTQSWSSQTYFNPINLADVSKVNIKTAYTAVADPTRYYPYEIQGSIADIEANLPGYTVTTFATPYSSSSDAINSLIQGSAVELNRNVLNDTPQAPSSYLFSSLDMYNIASLVPEDIDTTNVARSVDGLVEALGTKGGIFCFYSHDYTEFTLAQWNSLFSELKAIDATVMTASQAATYIKSHGTLVNDGTNKYWNSSVTLSPNYAPSALSPTQGAHLQP